MQAQLKAYPSGPEATTATAAMTGPEPRSSRSRLKPPFLTTNIIARLACSAFLWIAAVLLSPVLAAAPLAAGFETLQAADGADKPLEVAVWYPTDAVAKQVDLSHNDTAVALAQAGYVVAAVAHTGDNFADQSREVSMVDRPRHISRVIDHMLTTWPGRDRIDATRIGVFGHSSGGFTALAVVGGAATRDFAIGMHPLVFTTPVSRAALLGSRFVGATVAMFVVFLALGRATGRRPAACRSGCRGDSNGCRGP